MGSQKNAVDVRVIVGVPDVLMRMDARIRLAEAMVPQIMRHVDDVYDANVDIVYEFTCEHCGYPWTEGEDAPHNGGCCDEDCKAMPEGADDG